MDQVILGNLQEVAKAAVIAAIGGDKNHGWGVDDSVEVIESILAEDASLAPADLLANKYTPSEEAMSLVKQFINPSAFRQILEGKLLAEPVKKDKKASVKLSF